MSPSSSNSASQSPSSSQSNSQSPSSSPSNSPSSSQSQSISPSSSGSVAEEELSIDYFTITVLTKFTDEYVPQTTAFTGDEYVLQSTVYDNNVAGQEQELSVDYFTITTFGQQFYNDEYVHQSTSWTH